MAGQTIQVSVLADTRRFSRAMRNLGRQTGLSRLGGMFKSAGRKMVGFLRSGVKYGTMLGTVLAGLAVKGGITRALDLDSAQKMMTQFGLSTKQADKVVAQIGKTFEGTPFSTAKGATFASQMIANGRKASDTVKDVGKVANLAAVSMDKDFGATADVIAKIGAKGKVSAVDLDSLSKQGIPIRAILAKSLGVTGDKLNDLVSSGGLTYEKFMDIVGSSKQLKGASKKLGETASTAFKNIKAWLDIIVANFVGALLPGLTKGANKLGDFLQKLGPGAKAAGQAFGKWLKDTAVPAVKTMATWIGDHLVPVAKDLWKWFADKLVPALKDLGKTVGGAILKNFNKLKDAFADSDTNVGSLASTIGDALLGALNTLKPILSTVADVLGTVGAFIIKHKDAFTSLAVGIGAAVVAYKAYKTAVALAQAAQALFNVVMSANPLGAVLLAVTALTAGLVWFFTKTETGRKIVEAAWSGIKKAVSAVTDWFTGTAWPAIQTFFGWITGGMADVRDFFSDAWDKVTGFFSAAWDWVSGTFKKHWSTLLALLGGPIALAVALIVKHWDSITAAFRKAWKWIQDHVIAPWKRVFTVDVPAAFDKAKAKIGAAWDAVVGFFSNAWKKISAKLDDLKKKIVGWASTALTWLKQAGRDIITGLKDGVSAIVSTINSWLYSHVKKPVIDYFSGAVSWLKSAGKDAIAGLKNGIIDKMKGIGSWLKAHLWEPIKNGVKSLFGIHSPSTEFEWFGSMMIRGLVKGLVKGNPSKFIKQVFGGVTNDAKKALGYIVENSGDQGLLMKLFGAGAGGGIPGIATWLVGHGFLTSNKAGGPVDAGGYIGGGGVQKWKGTAMAAMAAAGLPMKYLGLLMHRMQVESGGNPYAINNWDSNALAGMPSQGLMQTIPPTFNAYAGKYRSRGITDPFANIYAAIKYTLARYGLGGILRAWGGTGGYAAGTLSAKGGWAWVGERGPELRKVRPGDRIKSHKDSVASTGGGGLHINHLAITVSADTLDGVTNAQAFMAWLEGSTMRSRLVGSGVTVA